MKIIEKWDEVPVFASRRQEQEFWQTHQIAERLMQLSRHSPLTRESATITLRFDPRMLARIKRVARGRYLNYQSMMKQWLAERLAEEIRRGDDE